MFGFLKDKLKKATDELKKVFKKKEEEAPKPVAEATKPVIEPISKEEKEEIKEVTEEVEKEIDKEDYESLPAEEKAFQETVKEDVQEEVQQEVAKAETAPEVEELTPAEEEAVKEVTHEVIEEAKEEREERREEREAEKKYEKAEKKRYKAELRKEAKEAIEIAGKVEDELEEVRETAEEKPKELERIEKKAEELALEPPKPKKKIGFLEKIFGKKNEAKAEAPREIKAAKEEKKGVLAKLFEKKLSEEEFEKFFAELEISLLESNIAFEVIQLLKKRLKEELVEKQIPRGKTEEILLSTIKNTFSDVLVGEDPENVIKHIKENKKKHEPTKFMFLGVNGVGKTTSLAKMCHWLQKKGFSVVLAASDTFRAASVEQLEKHASRLGVHVIKSKYGSDPAAVAFDAIEHAKSKGIDCVLIDSAGRQHTSQNLMDELKKLKRVAKPDFTIFVADALTGNDAVEQAREFGNQIGFDLIILGKADVDQKGGAILSVSYVSGKPLLFLGVGQDYNDLESFDKEKLIKRLI